MGKGLAFLNLKYWHPTNQQNLQKKWENEQKHAAQVAKAKEREIERKREEELARMRTLIAKRSGPESEQYRACILQAPVAFMYTEPPGLKQAREKDRERALHDERRKEYEKLRKTGELPRDQLRQMEKEMEGSMTVHEKNINRFAFLKNAPMKDDYCKNIEVHHKPFGMTIRNVKCFKCGQWGHRIGDIECPKHPSMEVSFLESLGGTTKPAGAPTEDVKAKSNDPKTDGSEDEWEEVSVEMQKSLPIRHSPKGGIQSQRNPEGLTSSNKVNDHTNEEKKSEDNVVEEYRGDYVLEDNVVIKNQKPIYGKYSENDANQQLVQSDEEYYEGNRTSTQDDFAFVKHLTEHQKREWLRELEKDEKKKRKKSRKSKKKKKKKSKRKHRMSDSSTDSDSWLKSRRKKKRKSKEASSDSEYSKKRKRKKKKSKRKRSRSSDSSDSDSEEIKRRRKR